MESLLLAAKRPWHKMDKNTTAALGNFINTAIKQPIGKYVFKHHTILTTTVRNFIDTSIKHKKQLLLETL